MITITPQGETLKGYRPMPRSAYLGKDATVFAAVGELCPIGG
jgi:hypothetical protein